MDKTIYKLNGVVLGVPGWGSRFMIWIKQYINLTENDKQ